jgi:VanZ like family
MGAGNEQNASCARLSDILLRNPNISATQNQQVGLCAKFQDSGWSNRILVFAIAGLLFLTLYPFRFDFHVVLPGNASPLLLGRGSKTSGLRNAILNVLLFVPFGIALTGKLRDRGKSRGFALVLALAAGALFSYGIEFLQIYIPERDSGWEDIFTNALGSVAGFVVYEILGKFALRFLSSCESLVEGLLIRRRAFVLLLVYFGLWFASSSLLQRKTRLSNWRADAPLVVGNDGSGKYPWKGSIDAVQVWNLALEKEAARRLSAGQAADAGNLGLMVDYEFSAAPTFLNQEQVSSELVWIPRAPASSDTRTLVLDGTSWLATKGAVADLVGNLQKTNQFTLRVVCTPGEGIGSDGRIISISQASGFSDLTLRQDDANLVFWFRNPLSASHAILAWYFPGVLTVGRTRDILYTYDGANLSLFIDGKLEPLTYRLSPGTALARSVRTVKPSELAGYNYIYYILVFCSAGALLGMAARNLTALSFAARFWLAFGLFIPAVLLEWILVSTSGRSLSFDYIGLSALLALGGFLWINSDRRALLRR